MDAELNSKVCQLIERQAAEGRQIGTQVCAYRDGKVLVDAWTGRMGPHDDRPVQPDTLFSSFSTTKGVAAAALHILADRGLIDYEAPVAKYWPEFAQNGKERITVAQAMSHQAGLHAVPVPLTADFVCDWDAGLRWIAEGTPAWEPGTATGYHALSYAWIVGGIVQGASGRHIKDVIREDIAEPLGIADQLFVGIPDGVEDRLATLGAMERPTNSPALQLPADADFFKAMPVQQTFTYNEMRIRKACIPSANGHFSARALARMYGTFANGGEIDGVRLVSKERIPQMYRCMTDGPDRVIFGIPLRKGIGFFLGGTVQGVSDAMGSRTTVFGHPGAGGSVAFADPEVGLSIAVTVNQMHAGLTAEGPVAEICQFIRAELGV